MVIVAYPTQECREIFRPAVSAAGATEPVESHHCVPLHDSMPELVRAVDQTPVRTASAVRYVAFDGPLLSAPRDSPARFQSPRNEFAEPGDETVTRSRVDLRVDTFQWAPPRGLAAEEAPPYFGEEIEELIRQEQRGGQQQAPTASSDNEDL